MHVEVGHHPSVTAMNQPHVTMEEKTASPKETPQHKISSPSILEYLQRPLDVNIDNREIRVLDLLPGEDNEELECVIRIVTLTSGEVYEALSYVWGSHILARDIKIAGRTVPVTQSLHEALRRLRDPTRQRSLWIDQLCINQLDTEERASQVAVMRTIYLNASRGIIWLGELDQQNNLFSELDAKAVFDFLRFAADAGGVLVKQEQPVLFHNTVEGKRARTAFEAFSMYGNPWWSRIWTIQEAIIPKSAKFIWGPFELSRDSVYKAVKNLHGDHMGSLFSKEFCANRFQYTPLLRRLLYPVRGFLHCKEREDALDLLMRWRHRDSTNPRDKVYALRGLVAPEDLPSAISCNYDITASSLFERVTLDQIKRENGLRALVGSSEMQHVTPGLATWAIDFACSNRVGRRQLKWWTHSHRYKGFNACNDQVLQLSIVNDSKTIGLSGVFVDDIVHVGEVYSVDDSESIDASSISRVIQQAQDFFQKYQEAHPATLTYPNGQAWETVFWRTMIGDYIMKEFPTQRAEPHHEKDFSSLLSELAQNITRKPSESMYTVPKLGGISSLESNSCHERDLQDALNSQAYGNVNNAQNILYESLCGMVPNHAFFITAKGYLGIGPPNTTQDDQVWVFGGGRVPFVMRKAEVNGGSEDKHKVLFVGDSYVHGMMDGEIMRDGCEMQEVWID